MCTLLDILDLRIWQLRVRSQGRPLPHHPPNTYTASALALTCRVPVASFHALPQEKQKVQQRPPLAAWFCYMRPFPSVHVQGDHQSAQESSCRGQAQETQAVLRVAASLPSSAPRPHITPSMLVCRISAHSPRGASFHIC